MVRRIKDRTRSRFNLAVTEVGGQDTWQRLEIGFAMVGNEARYVENTLEKVVRFIEGMDVAEIAAEERETLRYGELWEAGAAEIGPAEDWVPEAWQQDDPDSDGGEVR